MDKNSSKILISTLALLLLVSLTNGVNAETGEVADLPSIPAIGQEQLRIENITPLISSSRSLQKIINQGNQLINERITALNKLKKRVQKTKLTVEQKASLITPIDHNLSALSVLRTQLKADTTTTTAKVDLQKIYVDYRIFAVFIPKTNLMINLDVQQNHLTELTTYLEKVQLRINEAKVKGKDVTRRQRALDEAKAMVSPIQNKITNASNKLLTLKPADYPNASKTIITDTNKSLREIRQLFISLNKTVKQAK